MRYLALTLLVLGILVPGCKKDPEWQLPIHLGDPKNRVYEILGRPSDVVESPPNEIYRFRNSGLTITFDPNQNVSEITVHGVGNRKFMTYPDHVIAGLRVTDKIWKFESKLGEPLQRKDERADDKEASLVWSYTPLLIEVVYWNTGQSIDGFNVTEGELKSINISMAYGGQ